MRKRTPDEEMEALRNLRPAETEPPSSDMMAYEEMLSGKGTERRMEADIGRLYWHILRLEDEIKSLKRRMRDADE